MSNATRRKVTIECPNCKRKFESTLRWEGLPEKDFCSPVCGKEFEDYEAMFEDDHGAFDYTKFRGDW